ncbi:hypothetical protein DMUE_4620 [Dictyocoela muelleri]|nr:hypothetical protein DMUE_4620 [Dictyocoela muelleri]
MKNFILSTYNGTIPNFVDHDMNRPVIINMENIYYIDSYYYKGGSLNLNKFCSLDCDVYLKMSLPLKTYRGNFNITREDYEKFIEIAKPHFFNKYGESNENFYNKDGTEMIVKSPDSWFSMVEILEEYDLIDTDFINKMVDRGERIISNVIVDTKYDCECCGSPGYLDYLWRLGEISAKMLIARHNYKELVKYFDFINKNS